MHTDSVCRRKEVVVMASKLGSYHPTMYWPCTSLREGSKTNAKVWSLTIVWFVFAFFSIFRHFSVVSPQHYRYHWNCLINTVNIAPCYQQLKYVLFFSCVVRLSGEDFVLFCIFFGNFWYFSAFFGALVNMAPCTPGPLYLVDSLPHHAQPSVSLLPHRTCVWGSQSMLA